MIVPVMQVREMGVAVREGIMLVLVGMRLLGLPWERVRMLMMRIVQVRVGMIEPPMRVFVLMMLGQMQPHPRAHQRG